MKTISAQLLLLVLVPSISVLLLIMATCILLPVNMSILTRDVASIAAIHPLSGILSNLGIILWCSSASVCGFVAMILRKIKPGETFRFFVCSTLLSTYLLLDDFFQIHESLAHRYLGLSEDVVVATLGAAFIAYLIAFRQIIMKTQFVALLLALGFMVISVAMDLILEPWLWRLSEWAYFFEDGAKWMGIAFWCSYYVHTSYHVIGNAVCLSDNSIQPESDIPVQ